MVLDPITFDLEGPAATRALGARLAVLARIGDVIGLTGDLGAGKTVFARGFITALATVDEVPSPTFTLLQTYDGANGPIYHFDLYRLEAADDAFALGIEEAFAEGVSLIEWPERLGALLPARRLLIVFEFGAAENMRRAALDFDAAGDWGKRLKDAGFGS